MLYNYLSRCMWRGSYSKVWRSLYSAELKNADIETASPFCGCSRSEAVGLKDRSYPQTRSVGFRLYSSAAGGGGQAPKQKPDQQDAPQQSQPANRPPPLVAFPKIVWPSLIKSIRNFILTTFIIKPYFDRDFSLQEFVSGSKKAVEVVSKRLAEGNVKSLEGLVTSDIVPSLQRSISLMSMAQREQIAISVDDIYFSFPYQVQIGIIFDEEEGQVQRGIGERGGGGSGGEVVKEQRPQKRFVEVTMVYHALRGLGVMRSRGEEPPINMGVLPEYQAKLSVCNYRFVREYTKGVDGDWTVNLLNHFKPDDVR